MAVSWAFLRQIVFVAVSLILFVMGYVYYSRSDPCIAVETKYWKLLELDCELKRKFTGPLKATGVWLFSCLVLWGLQYVDTMCTRIADSSDNRFTGCVFRTLVEIFHTAAAIVSPVLSTEVSGYITLKSGSEMEYVEAGFFYTYFSIVFLLFALGNPDNYGLLDAVESVFLGVLFMAGKKKSATLLVIAAICSAYRLVFFFIKEMKIYLGRNEHSEERLINTAPRCIRRSRRHLTALEDNLPERLKDPLEPPMMHILNVRAELDDLEKAIPLRRRR